MLLTVGSTLQSGKYTITAVLGQGLSRTVKAVQAPLNRAVVLKTINLQQRVPIDIAHLRQAFVTEVHQLAQCHHPGFVGLLDLFEEDGLPFVVMDFIEGHSLTKVVKQQGALSEADALRQVRQVGSVLAALHRQGLIHQDVKPENFIRPVSADFAVLVDYGLIQREMLRALYGAGAIPLRDYAAPEVVRSPQEQELASQPRITPAVDVYALAASLYFLVTGQKPTAALLRQYSPLVAPRQLQPNLSPALEQAILAGMELDAAKRPQTIAAWFSLLPGTEAEMPPVQSDGMNQATNGAAVGDRPASVTLPPTERKGQQAASISTPLMPTNGIAPAPMPPKTKQTTMVVAHPQPPQPVAKRRTNWRSLVLTGLFAGVIGSGSGLALRMSGSTGPGSSIFHTEQAFPPLPDFPKRITSADSAPPTLRPQPSEPPVQARPSLPRTYRPPVPPESAPAAVSPASRRSPVPPAAEPSAPITPEAPEVANPSAPLAAPSPEPSAPPPTAPVRTPSSPESSPPTSGADLSPPKSNSDASF